jgi:hypothetical protein
MNLVWKLTKPLKFLYCAMIDLVYVHTKTIWSTCNNIRKLLTLDWKFIVYDSYLSIVKNCFQVDFIGVFTPRLVALYNLFSLGFKPRCYEGKKTINWWIYIVFFLEFWGCAWHCFLIDVIWMFTFFL